MSVVYDEQTSFRNHGRQTMTKVARAPRADGEATSRRILEAAGALFAQFGFAETANKAVAEKAAVDVASINYHFGGRDGLYRAVLGEAHRHLVSLETLRQIDGFDLPPSEKLRRLIDVILDGAGARAPWAAQVIARELASPSSHLRALAQEEAGPKVEIMLRLLADLADLPVDDPALLRCLISIISPCATFIIVAGANTPVSETIRAMPRDDVADHVYGFAMAGLAAVRERRIKVVRPTE